MAPRHSSSGNWGGGSWNHSGSSSWGGGDWNHSGSTSYTNNSGQTYSTNSSASGHYGDGWHNGSGTVNSSWGNSASWNHYGGGGYGYHYGGGSVSGSNGGAAACHYGGYGYGGCYGAGFSAGYVAPTLAAWRRFALVLLSVLGTIAAGRVPLSNLIGELKSLALCRNTSMSATEILDELPNLTPSELEAFIVVRWNCIGADGRREPGLLAAVDDADEAFAKGRRSNRGASS